MVSNLFFNELLYTVSCKAVRENKVSHSRDGLSEGLIALVWKYQRLDNRRLVTTQGQPLQVIYPGRLNGDEGPDFQGALVSVGDSHLREGDVEVHLRASDWRAHRHHLDPRYNGVILHVVMWDGGSQPVYRQDGSAVPTLSLDGFLDVSPADLWLWASLPQLPSEPCHQTAEVRGADGVAPLLDQAGEERFRLKAARFGTELALEPAEQVLYAGIMEALGYSRNQAPFRELARRLPLEVLAGYTQGKPREKRLVLLQALLLGSAGLLDRQESLLWDTWQSLGGSELVSRDQWLLFRVRPENHPGQRLAAASHVLCRYLGQGLVDSLLDLVSRGGEALERGLVVESGGKALLGRSRAREIIVNIVLPFFMAWAEHTNQPGLGGQALELYRKHPALEENRVTREMRAKLGMKYSSAGGARRQQGLIHMEHTRCRHHGCDGCPLACYP